MSISSEDSFKNLLTNRYLTFKLGDETYAFPVAVVREVLEQADITSVPHSSPYMKGVFNLRGSVIPVLDISSLLQNNPPINLNSKDSLIVADVINNGSLIIVAILATEVEEVIELPKETIEPSKSLISHAEFIKEIGNKDDHFILILDINHIVTHIDAAVELLVYNYGSN